MSTRDRLLVIFFATVGVNARLKDLPPAAGCWAILCAITVAYVFLQNAVGTLGALTFGLPTAAGDDGPGRAGGRARHHDRLGPG